MSTSLESMRIRFNPFEPAASGAPLQENLWLPPAWQEKLTSVIDHHCGGRGVKALALSGEYGSGKTYILKWLQHDEFPRRRIKPFYFDNPGVQFYDLANSLLRQIGRKDFAKAIWELSGVNVKGYQHSLFSTGYEAYLEGFSHIRRKQQAILGVLQTAIKKAGIVRDDEIAHRLAKVVADTPGKPFFEYRDFITGRRESLVAEGEEAPYFAAILRTLKLAAGIESVVFLVDEFEEVSLQKRLSRRESYDYLATLKRLINLTEDDLWLVVGMTPDAVDKTKQLEPALWERFTGEGEYLFEIPALKKGEASELIARRLASARKETAHKMFPFPEDVSELMSPATISSPRRLVKVCFFAISEGARVKLPFSKAYLQRIEKRLYPVIAKRAAK